MSDIPAIRGYFINLDRAEVRRKKMEMQIEKYGLSGAYTRVPAVDGQAFPKRAGGKQLREGEVATFRSHFDVLREAAASTAYVHILEDDTILSPSLTPVLSFALKLGLFSVYDIVFLDLLVAPDFFDFNIFKTAAATAFEKSPAERKPTDFRIIDIEQTYFLGLASYVVNPGSFARILDIFQAELKKGPGLAVDHLIRREIRAGRLRAGCVLPFVTTVGLEETVNTQSGRREDKDFVMALTLIRQSFFVDRDLAELKRQTDALVARINPEERGDLHANLLHQLVGCFRG